VLRRRYAHPVTGRPVRTQALGFSKFGESLGETVTIPSAAGSLAGAYTFRHTYTSGTGLALDDVYPSAGGLPAETVGHTYLATPLDLPKGLGGSIDGYAQNTGYDAYGDVIQEEIGTGSSSYDAHTLNLTEQLVTRSVDTPADVDEEQYTYDLAGLVTSQTSTRLGSSSATETQCYAYDGLERLTAAWTATDACATAPSSSDRSMLGDGLGSSSEYWTTWAYGDNDSVSSQVEHSVTGGTDTTVTGTYSSSQPDALVSSVSSGGSSSTSTYGYDAAGNMTTRDTAATGNQALTYNAAGQLTRVVSSTQGATNYVYDADGNLLLDEGPANWTLYLPGEDITLDTATDTVTGARIIPLPGGGDVVRTGSANSYYFEIPDQQGTSTLYLDSTAQTPTWRQFTPYGASRGTTVTWVDDRGFLGKAQDSVTGLTDLGARWYDPSAGQFTSPDPLLNTSDPQDLDPYAYSADDPVNQEDPSGEFYYLGSGCGTGATACNDAYSQRQSSGSFASCPAPLLRSACGSYRSGWDYQITHAPAGGTASSDSGGSSEPWYDRLVHGAEDVGRSIVHGGEESAAALRAAAEKALQAAWRHRQDLEMAAFLAVQFVPGVDGAADLGMLLDEGLDAAEAADKGIAADEEAGLSCGGQSFTSATKVLLASGIAVPIAALKPGEKVLAADAKTGKTGAEIITRVLVHHDADLYNLKISGRNGTSVIGTTSSHLFWVPGSGGDGGRWVKAAALKHGTHLRTPRGTAATVVGGWAPVQREGWMWDLTGHPGPRLLHRHQQRDVTGRW
jgi:RHS repeat-associated protein